MGIAPELEVKKLSGRQKTFLRRIAAGWTARDACFSLGYSEARGSLLVNSTLGRAYLDELDAKQTDELVEREMEEIFDSQKVRRAIQDAAEASVERLISLRNSGDEKIALAASRDILDRSGLKAPEKVEVESQVFATPGLLEALSALRTEEPTEEESEV